MPADTVLIIVLAALGGAALPLLAWLNAQRRIRHLEMTLLTRSTDAERYDELRGLLQQLAIQTEQLADTQDQLARRFADQSSQLPPARPDPGQPITPH